MKLFQGDEHKTFYFEGGKPAALMVHGFPGSPAELRPLASALNLLGWTTHGLLLPGFGEEIETLFEQGRSEWVAAIETAMADLAQKHQPILLIGYSMGGALVMDVAAAHSPAAIVLLAPFWKLGSAWQQVIGFLLKPFFRQMKPLRKVDFSNPQVRQSVLNFFPEVDLDDLDSQQAMRELTIPTHIFETLHQVGRQAFRSAPNITCPTLVLQGANDNVVPPARTDKLVKRIAGPTTYHKFAIGHDLIDPQQAAWPEVETSIIDFVKLFNNPC